MTQEEKQLLLKDLCARLPYGVKVEAVPYADPQILCSVDPIRKEFRLDFGEYKNIFATNWVGEEYSVVKPYLRPISSLTAEECDKLFEILDIDEKGGDWLKINDINVIRLFTEKGKDFYEIAEAIEYLYSIHIDFRDMIEKGLALEAPEDIYKTE